MGLLNSQKNDIFDHIIAVGMSPSDFYIENNILKFKTNDHFLFEIGQIGAVTQVSFSPGKLNLKESETIRNGWKNVLVRVKRWLTYLKAETEVIDKWSAFKDIADYSFLFSFSESDSEKFSNMELRYIYEKIEEVKDQIGKLGMSQTILQGIIDELNELKAQASKFTKKDWKNLFIGAIFSKAIDVALTGEVFEKIKEIIITTFTITKEFTKYIVN